MHLGALVHFVNTILKPLCVGKNPLEIDKLWTTMYYDTYKLGETGLKMEAISGVDIALWDIFGKVDRPADRHPARRLLPREGPDVRQPRRGEESRLARPPHPAGDGPAGRAEHRARASPRSRSACTGSTTSTSIPRPTGRCSASASRSPATPSRSASTPTTATPRRPPSSRAGASRSLGIYHYEEPVMVDDYAAYARVGRCPGRPDRRRRARVHPLAVPRADPARPGRHHPAGHRQVRRLLRDPQDRGTRRGPPQAHGPAHDDAVRRHGRQHPLHRQPAGRPPTPGADPRGPAPQRAVQGAARLRGRPPRPSPGGPASAWSLTRPPSPAPARCDRCHSARGINLLPSAQHVNGGRSSPEISDHDGHHRSTARRA